MTPADDLRAPGTDDERCYQNEALLVPLPRFQVDAGWLPLAFVLGLVAGLVIGLWRAAA